MNKTMQGLEFSTESMAKLVMDSRHDDLECFLDKGRGVWIIRYWHDLGRIGEEDEWGAVHEAETLREVLDAYVYGAYFS